MRKGFVYLLMSAVALISLGTLNSCKDYEEDLRQETRINLDTQAATLGGLLDQLRTDCNTRIDSLRDALDDCKALCAAERALMNARIDSLAAVTADLDAARKADSTLMRSLIEALNVRADGLQTRIEANEAKIAALEAADVAMQAAIDNLEAQIPRITQLETALTLLTAKVERNEKDIENLQKDVKDLQKELQDEIKDINKQISDLQVKITQIESGLKAQLNTLENTVLLLTAKVDGFDARVNELKSFIEAYQQAQQDFLKTALDQQNDIYKQLLQDQQAYFDNALSTYKDYVDGKFDDIIDAQNALKEYLEGKLNDKYDALSDKYDALSDKVDTYKSLVDDLKTAVNNYAGKVDDFINSYINTIEGVQNTISVIQNTLNTLSSDVAALQGEMIVVTAKANEALERAKNDSVWIKNLEKVVEDVQAKAHADSLNTNYRIDTLSKYADRINEALAEAQRNYDAAIALLKERDSLLNVRDNKLGDSIYTMNTTLNTIKGDYKKADSLLNVRIDTLAQHVAKNEGRIAKVEEDLANLTAKVGKLENAHKALVTSIEIQETVNPVFGSINLPADVRSTILFGYYGEAVIGGEFPSAFSDGFYAYSKDDSWALSDADYNRLNLSSADLYTYNSGDILVNGGDKLNIGTLYLTVNPTKADFTGTEFSLENSAGQAAKATLSDLAPSAHKVTFGYNRAKTTAASDNGFYEATASIQKADVKSSAIHSEGMKNAVAALVKKAKGAKVSIDKKGHITYTNDYALNVSDLAETILDNMSGITDAYAVKASWNDEVVGQRSVYSQYGLAATAVTNLGGYSTFQNDTPYETVPGYEVAWKLIDKLGEAAKKAIESAVGQVKTIIDGVVIKNVTFTSPEESLGNYTIDMSINVPAGSTVAVGDNGFLYIYDGTVPGHVLGVVPGTAKLNSEGDIVFSFNSKEIDLYPYIKPVFTAIEEAYGDVNDTYEQLRKLFDNVNGLLGDIKSYENKLDNVTDAMHNLLKALNERVVDFVNSANYRLQPIIIANENDGAHLLSQAKSQPSEVAASTELILTNFVGEILAPALKKHVACTNVYNGDKDASTDADCMRKLRDFNGQDKVNEVLDGSVTRLNISGLQAGYVYELAISALDYEGKQTTRKHYVKVK